MQNLALYISAIRDLQNPGMSPVQISRTVTESESFDAEQQISENCIRFEFSNGVVIRQMLEWDDLATEAACRDCWITYQVVCTAGYSIEPLQKQFYNPCQETFWLKKQVSTS